MRKKNQIRPVEIRPENISNDDLWFAAKYDVIVDRDFSNLDKYFTAKERMLASAMLRVVLANKQFDAEYASILECQFENYDSGNI